MKAIALMYIASLMAFTWCGGQSLEKIVTIEFRKETRAFLDKLVISKDSVQGTVENHRAAERSGQYASAIDRHDWAKLVSSLKDVSLKDLDGLQSPTMDRAHDGAIHSSIVITFEDGKTVSHGFDNENPHPDLKPLLEAILEHRTDQAGKK